MPRKTKTFEEVYESYEYYSSSPPKRTHSRPSSNSKKVYPTESSPKKPTTPPKQPSPSNFILIHLKSASSLPLRSFQKKPNPYCLLEIGKAQKTSTRKRLTCDPIWDEYYKMKFSEIDEKLVIYVVHKSKENEDVMGRVEIEFDLLKQNKKKIEKSFLVGEKGGTLNVSVILKEG